MEIYCHDIQKIRVEEVATVFIVVSFSFSSTNEPILCKLLFKDSNKCNGKRPHEDEEERKMRNFCDKIFCGFNELFAKQFS